MDKQPELTGLNLEWVYNSRSVCMCKIYLPHSRAYLPNFEVENSAKKTLSGSFPLDIVLPARLWVSSITNQIKQQ